MKILRNIIISIIISIILLSFISSKVQAIDNIKNNEKIIKVADINLDEMNNLYNVNNSSSVTEIIKKIFSIAQLLIAIAAIIVVILKGVDFATKAQSAKAEADFKKELVPIAIGATIIFSIVTILKTIISVATSTING